MNKEIRDNILAKMGIGDNYTYKCELSRTDSVKKIVYRYGYSHKKQFVIKRIDGGLIFYRRPYVFPFS